MKAASQPIARNAWAARLAAACYVTLRLTGWLAVTLACVAACWALLFVMLGEFSFSGFALQVDNFAARYVAAEPARQDAFRGQFWAASGALFLIAGVLRRHSLRGLMDHSKESADGEN